MVKDVDSSGCLTFPCILQFLSIREFKVIFFLPFFRPKCFVWKNCVWDECYRKNLVIIIYIYVNFYMKKSVGREEDMSWFDLQECLPRLFLRSAASCADFIVVSSFIWILNTKANSNGPHGIGGREDNATDFSSCFVQIEIRPWTPFCCIHHHATNGGSGVFCFHANI